MKDYKPYKYWSRDILFNHVSEACKKTGNSDLIPKYKKIIFDKRWNPSDDYNGCNCIQDRLHPFPPCIEHDFNWLVLGGGIDHDRQFRIECEKFGSSKGEAIKNFIGVRIGWIFWFKWGKILKRNKLKL